MAVREVSDCECTCQSNLVCIVNSVSCGRGFFFLLALWLCSQRNKRHRWNFDRNPVKWGCGPSCVSSKGHHEWFTPNARMSQWPLVMPCPFPWLWALRILECGDVLPFIFLCLINNSYFVVIRLSLILSIIAYQCSVIILVLVCHHHYVGISMLALMCW